MNIHDAVRKRYEYDILYKELIINIKMMRGMAYEFNTFIAGIF